MRNKYIKIPMEITCVTFKHKSLIKIGKKRKKRLEEVNKLGNTSSKREE